MTVESASSECFGKVMASMPGFRFHPTDEELIMYYLKRKMCSRKLKLDVIREIDVYKWDPEELPGQSVLKTGDRQWFFFSPRDRKYPNAARSNRATRHGYWKATGKDRNVMWSSRAVGVKKTLVFYKGRAPNGERTDWVMHEYTMDEKELERCQSFKDYYALYKLFKKSGPGPKNGEQYGAPFKEEEWTDDDFVDFNINSANCEVPTQQLDEVISVDTITVNGLVQPLLDDEIEEIMKTIIDDELVGDQLHLNGYSASPLVVAEETQSAVVDEFCGEVTFPEPNKIFEFCGEVTFPEPNKIFEFCGEVTFPEPNKIFHPSSEQRDQEPSYDFPQSATSHLHVSEAPEVTSVSNFQGEEHCFHEDDFLEIDDLIGPETALSNIDNPLENLQFEDGLSELDLYHDAQMFLRDLGPINQETVSHPYINSLDTSIANQNNELLSNQEAANQTGGELWMHGQGNIVSPAEHIDGSFSLPTSGVVCESSSFRTESNEPQGSSVGGVAAGRFSSSLWAFVESIPTTPASASENALVNRAFERMSSFNRLRIGIKNTNGAAGNDTATMKRAGRKGFFFLFLPVLVALCAFLWVSMGTLRLLGRCTS